MDDLSRFFSRAAHTAVAIPHSTTALVFGGESGEAAEDVRPDLIRLTPAGCAAALPAAPPLPVAALASPVAAAAGGADAAVTTVEPL